MRGLFPQIEKQWNRRHQEMAKKPYNQNQQVTIPYQRRKPLDTGSS